MHILWKCFVLASRDLFKQHNIFFTLVTTKMGNSDLNDSYNLAQFLFFCDQNRVFCHTNKTKMCEVLQIITAIRHSYLRQLCFDIILGIKILSSDKRENRTNFNNLIKQTVQHSILSMQTYSKKGKCDKNHSQSKHPTYDSFSRPDPFYY